MRRQTALLLWCLALGLGLGIGCAIQVEQEGTNARANTQAGDPCAGQDPANTQTCEYNGRKICCLTQLGDGTIIVCGNNNVGPTCTQKKDPPCTETQETCGAYGKEICCDSATQSCGLSSQDNTAICLPRCDGTNCKNPKNPGLGTVCCKAGEICATAASQRPTCIKPNCVAPKTVCTQQPRTVPYDGNYVCCDLSKEVCAADTNGKAICKALPDT
jgi:hypothetical protein